MTKKAAVTKASVTRVIQAASACGLNVCEIIVTAEGVRLIYNSVDRPAVNDNTVGPKQWD
ncbi:hypothetical protein [Thalassospira lohafexi]|uniref:Uncharacterized protein n=1 Tax=Thalassospira lohafexi TaxID=744227 RepID=A0A2N3L3S3_9PROT|nr:hypothetical protein [Thalassospira lohafexi]PKR57464.1 hypothetical protein COO92_16110 [Thalassospira lohafexi]